MSLAQQSNYLESKVLTSPPHRLHLMLIEGAIRFGGQAEAALRRGEAVAAAPALMRMLDIVGELLAGVRERKSELNDRLAEFYWFLFRRVSEAKIREDARLVAEALGLLEYERQTWQLVCDKLGSDGAVQSPRPAMRSHATPAPQAGFSLEA